MRLLTYATKLFSVRRMLLNASARASKAVDEIAAYTPKDLEALGFTKSCPDICLTERGGGWWAWKPFLIRHELENMKEGEWLLYCDVGRSYPFKIIDCPLQNLVEWTEERKQVCMPGVLIPWNGPMSQWTKRDAFVLTEMDHPDYYTRAPIQASFSLWKAGDETKAIADRWLDWCSDRRLITDDANTCGKENLSYYQDHRHDQSLFTLLCMREGITGISIGDDKPNFDEKNPAQISRALGEKKVTAGLATKSLKLIAYVSGVIEASLRKLGSKLR